MDISGGLAKKKNEKKRIKASFSYKWYAIKIICTFSLVWSIKVQIKKSQLQI